VPELSSIEKLEILSQDMLSLMIRHGQLRPFINSIITEQESKPIQLSESEHQKAAKIYRQRHNLNSTEDIKAHCTKYGFDESQLKWQVQLQERIIRSSIDRFANKAELHYLTRKEQLDQISYSQLVVKNENFAQELYLRIKEDGANFKDLALELTKGTQRKPGWIIGPIQLARVPKPLNKRLQSVTPGTLLEPIHVQTNWVVARLDQYQPTEFDETMERRMCLELFQQHVNQLVDKHIDTITSRISSNNSTNQSK